MYIYSKDLNIHVLLFRLDKRFCPIHLYTFCPIYILFCIRNIPRLDLSVVIRPGLLFLEAQTRWLCIQKQQTLAESHVKNRGRVKEYFFGTPKKNSQWFVKQFLGCTNSLLGEVGGWGRDPKKCTGRDWGMGSSTLNETYAPSLSTIYDGA